MTAATMTIACGDGASLTADGEHYVLQAVDSRQTPMTKRFAILTTYIPPSIITLLLVRDSAGLSDTK